MERISVARYLLSEQTNRLINTDVAKAIVPMETTDGWAICAWYGKDNQDGNDLIVQISFGTSEEHMRRSMAAINKAVGANIIRDYSALDAVPEAPDVGILTP
jgi:hypothetical protein